MRKPGPPSIITVAVVTTITIIFWIFFSVYQILTGEVDVNVPPELLRPINPTLNQEILSDLKGRSDFEREEVLHFSRSSQQNQQPTTEVELPETTLTPTTAPTQPESEESTSTPSGELEQ